MTYRTLSDLEKRKKVLEKELATSQKIIAHSWHSLFGAAKHEVHHSPTARLTHALTLGSNVIDGALLGWKLYRKFRR